MALGILEPGLKNVQGTVYVYEEERRHDDQLRIAGNLKTDTSGKKAIIKVPQPSDDPNDPLNWSRNYRDTILVVLTIVAVLATTAAPLLAANSVFLANYFLVTFQDAANLTAFHLCGVAVGALIFVPSARVWGKRHVFLFGALLMVIASAWGGSTHKSKNYTSLVWARTFQGVALAPFESLTNAVVGDLYYVHERGPRMAFVNTAIFGGAFLTPVFCGMIDLHLGWQWSFYFLSIFSAVGFLAILFLVPETAYPRALALNTDITAHQDINLNVTSPGSSDSHSSADADDKDISMIHRPPMTIPGRRDPYTKRLLPFNGRKTSESYFKLLLRPFPLYVHPAVFYGCLLQGVIIGWTVMVGAIMSLIFLSPPLFFTEEKTGYMYTAAFIGAMIGLVVSALYTETVTRLMIRLNHGKYEPEFRLLLVIPTVTMTAIGLYGFGITSNDTYKYGWLIPDVFLAFIIMSMVMGAIASAQYLLDAHRDIDIEIFTNLIIFKNMFSFLLSYKAFDWMFQIGIKHMFIIFGSIEVVICVLAIPMYVFGKINRAFWQKHDLLKMCRLR